MEVCDIVQEAMTKAIQKKCKKAKWVGGLQWTSKNKADNEPEEAARAW